ncbi:FAD-dependent monooxygenase [Actinomadura sp. KC06]|uniref:FAD-dependent oxidoreductase n=1 Tax=Actinomadura sp. KC06 TaxID=2530369 RepID=UPI0010468C1B|nr:NAD(P)/FAD-dependent oxidoreductase [Actinomadura sp. KC06]TDD35632.1 FAD-dependent monooxygenase [Actinomadura sp. KC06]
MTAPVIVVGAGPVGLAAALALAAEQVPVTVLEAERAGVGKEWRGSTLHPPTLALLDRIGAAADAVAHGVRVDRLQFRDLQLPDRATFSYSVLEGRTPFPFRVQYEQYKLLRLLRELAEASPHVDLRHEHRVTGLTGADDGAADATVTLADGTRLTGPYVVAADGAHSALRKLAGIGFPGDTYPSQSLVAATPFPFEDVVDDLGPISYWSGPNGRLSLIRTPDVWRVATSTTVDAAASAEGTGGTHPELAAALDLLVGDRSWAANPLQQHQLYRSHQRVADRFRAGRLLLAGDAAHLSSTTGGMGLNSGVHDAFDLAARLGPALRAGGDGEAEAGAYAAARRDAAVRVVQPATRTVRAGVDATGRDARLARLRDLAATAADPAAALRHVSAMSMLDAVEGASR